MLGCKRLGPLFGGIAVVLALAPCVSGQGLQNVLRARARVFSAVGPGVTALKRDASGRYFILAEPASAIFIFDAAGERLGQFPNANSHGATIRYAVAIDVDSLGRLFVADRGDNSVKIFAPDGSLAALVHVTAPTSVVALSDGQFAVTTLQSKLLVQIMDEEGATVRTFGEPTDEPGTEPSTGPVVDRGRIAGDPAGNIYFAFTSLPDPTVQRFDRFGYSSYGSVMSVNDFGPQAGRTGREVDLGYTMAGLSSPSVGAWTDLHSLTAVTVGNRSTRGARGGAASPPAGVPSSSSLAAGTAAADGNVLDYSSGDDSTIEDLDPSLLSAAETGNLGSALGEGFAMPGMMGMGFGDPLRGGEFDHGRPGFGMYRASATVRIALDDPSKRALGKPVITAIGVDPETQEVWAAVSDVLVHLDKNGNRIDTYYPVISGDSSLKMTSILVERDRILIGSDPWGVYEFARPDKVPSSTKSQNSIAPASPAPADPPAR